jgi:hypothetical protein
MLRFRGDRSTLLAALVAHWSEQQLAIPAAAPQDAASSMIQARAGGDHRIGSSAPRGWYQADQGLLGLG